MFVFHAEFNMDLYIIALATELQASLQILSIP